MDGCAKLCSKAVGRECFSLPKASGAIVCSSFNEKMPGTFEKKKENRQEFTLTTQARQLLLEITSCISFLWFSPHYERTLICTVSLRVIGKIFFKNSRSPCRFFIHIWNPSRLASFSILKKQTACPGTFYTPPLPCFHCWLFKQETYGKYGQKDFPKLASFVSCLRQPAPSGGSL